MSPTDPVDPPSDPAAADTTATSERRWRLVAVVPDAFAGLSANPNEQEAAAACSLLSALWHPALLAHCSVLPHSIGASAALPDDPHDIVVRAGESKRTAVVAGVLNQLGAPPLDAERLDDSIAADYMALGTCYWLLGELTRAMGHADVLDHASLTRETLGGAVAWTSGDFAGATNRLRAAFEVLTQARERIYPVDNYLMDVLLLDGAATPEWSCTALEERPPVTLLASGRAIEALATSDPNLLERVRKAIDENRVDIVGGAYDESAEALAPLESVLWQYRRGARAYESHLDGRNVETWARRRFALYPMLPQVARRFGLRFGYHLALDGGEFPVVRETKRLWESPDGSGLEVLARPPLSVENAVAGHQFPARLARTLKEDHVATLPFIRRPDWAATWFRDLRRSASYSPVFGRWVTAGEYFQMTDRPWEPFRPEPDAYGAPYLQQAVAARRPDPITRRACHARLRARLDSLIWVDAVAGVLEQTSATPSPGVDGSPSIESDHATQIPRAVEAIEDALENGEADSVESQIHLHLRDRANDLARHIVPSTENGLPGYLILNPLGWPRRVAVHLPEAAPHLPPDGPLKVSQFTEEGTLAVVDLPAFGFAWVAREPRGEMAGPPAGVHVRDLTLANQILEVEIDRATGGIRAVRRPGETSPRLAQQLVAQGPADRSSKMVADRVEVEYGGPALAQVVSTGRVIDSSAPDRTLAAFRQRVRLWWGRPILELLIEFTSLDEGFQRELAGAPDPWTAYLGCRWAWADAGATLRRSSFLGLSTTHAARPETPDIFEISTRGQRAALLFGGLAHQHRQGPRMLDTLLVAGNEQGREFQLSAALDLEYPSHAACDLMTPPVVVPIASGPPASGATGWFLNHDMPTVAITRVELLATAATAPFGLILHLVETAGRAVRGRLRMFRDPTSARLVDFLGEVIVELEVDRDSILLDLTAFEIACVEIALR